MRLSASLLSTRAALVVCGLGLVLIAAGVLAPSRPPVVAIVDLEKVFNSIEAHSARERELDASAASFQEKLKELEESVKELQAELDSFQPGSQSALELQNRVQAAVGEYRAYEQFVRLKLESEKARAMRETYLEIKEAAKTMAREAGIDMVLLDDSIPELERSNSQRTVQQISARRILYANTEFDISEDLIAYLDARFRSGGATSLGAQTP
jgi:Skp family chaperone for outer membrane proteins